MSHHSTPQRPSSHQSSSDLFKHTPPCTQSILKQRIAHELADATWELPSETLARALSFKSRKKDVPPLTIDELDDFGKYDIEIDTLGTLLDDAVEALSKAVKNLLLPTSKAEVDHYGSLITFLNACLDACRCVYNKSIYYNKLNFISFNRPTQDGVLGASPLKPDGAGANGVRAGELKLWWRPKTGDRSKTMEIPVEVKSTWRELVAQSGTYARAMRNARPLRQFSLVLAYNHSDHALRFLVFHAGGLTASPPLKLNKPDHYKNILCLILSLLTWKTPGDAGLPEWTNDVEMFLQKNPDDQEGLRMLIDKALYAMRGLRGRCSQVSSLTPFKNVAPPSGPKITTSLRRSPRIAERALEARPLTVSARVGINNDQGKFRAISKISRSLGSRYFGQSR
jgi:hypothetical protein